MLSLNFFVCTQVYSCDRFETMNAFIWNILKKFPFYKKQRKRLRVVLEQDWWPNHPILTVLQNRIRNFIFFFIPEDTLLTILVMPKFLFLLRNSDGNCPDDSNHKFLYSRMTELPNVTFENKIWKFTSLFQMTGGDCQCQNNTVSDTDQVSSSFSFSSLKKTYFCNIYIYFN